MCRRSSPKSSLPDRPLPCPCPVCSQIPCVGSCRKEPGICAWGGPWWRPETEPGGGGAGTQTASVGPGRQENTGWRGRKYCCLQINNVRLGGQLISLCAACCPCGSRSPPPPAQLEFFPCHLASCCYRGTRGAGDHGGVKPGTGHPVSGLEDAVPARPPWPLRCEHLHLLIRGS